MTYWKTYKKDLIFQCLHNAIKLTPKAVLWQQIEEIRNTYIIHFEKVSKEVCSAIIESDTAKIDPTKPIYIKCQNDQVIFKKDHYNYSKNFLEFSIPGIIQVLDRRKIERFYYLYQDHKVIRFESEEKDDEDRPLIAIDSIIVDISINGAGLVLDKKQVERVNVDQKFIITSVTDQILPDPFRVKISYINNYKLNEEELFKIGLQFDDSLDSVSFKSISKIVERKQIKVAGLSQKTYCGLTGEDQRKTLYAIERKNPILSKNIKSNIEYLDRLRYMTANMKVEFLQIMDHKLLAIALRLSSKELIYDLFYNVSTRVQEDFLELLKLEKPASAVCKTQDQIIVEIRKMEQTGQIILNPRSSTTYV